MTDHDVPVVAHGHVAGLDTLGNGADLVDFEQQCVAHFLLQCHVDSLDVGDQQVVADDLARTRNDFGQLSLSFEVVLVERILNRNHILVFSQVDLHVNQFLAGHHVRTRLETQVVRHLAVFFHYELTRRNVSRDRELARHACLFECFQDDLDCLLRVVDVRREASLVADVDGRLAVLRLHQPFQHLEHFSGCDHRVLETVLLHRHHHELLEREFVARVRTAVDDVQTRDRHAECSCFALSRLLVLLLDALLQRLALEVCLELEHVHAHRQNRVGAQLALVEPPLVRSAVE